MECKEFREIADSYLNDELLVETNHRVQRHLESCPECRREIAERREMRNRLSSAIKNAEGFNIDPVFADRLTARLKSAAFEKTFLQRLASVKVLVPALAAIIVGAGLAITFVPRYFDQPGRDFITEASFFRDHLLAAADTHRDCALKKLAYFISISKNENPVKTLYRERIVKPLEAQLSEKFEILDAHDCLYDGRLATHVILRHNGHVLSVILDKSENEQALAKNLSNSIVSERETGLQIAAFRNADRTVFVISDLPEEQNLGIARTLSDAWKQNTEALDITRLIQ
jgi:anti-sigma factor RsiW